MRADSDWRWMMLALHGHVTRVALWVATVNNTCTGGREPEIAWRDCP